MAIMLCSNVLHIGFLSCYFYFSALATILNPWVSFQLPSAHFSTLFSLPSNGLATQDYFDSEYEVASNQAHRCSEFASNLKLPNTTYAYSSYHAAKESLSLAGTIQSCGGSNLKAAIPNDLCRVIVDVSTTNSSSVRVEAWLPSDWNSRILASGVGGIGGCIDYNILQMGTQLRFASFGTNAGHNGSVGFDFFLIKPEVLNDFGWRGVHTEAIVAKEIVQQYYGNPVSKSYYAGCSSGGRLGFRTAMDYPEDFDGLLLGAPGVNWIRVVSSKGILARRSGWPNITSPAYVRDEQWNAIVKEQIRQLDPLDGVIDGVVDDPSVLHFDPEILACRGGVFDDSVCLNPQQVETVGRVYEPIADSSREIVYPSFELGSNPGVFSINQRDGKPYLNYEILTDFYRGAVYNDSTWTALNFSEADVERAVLINPGCISTTDSDLANFRARGGKVLSYHGRNDEAVTSANSMWYFNQVQKTLNLTLEEMQTFYRVFFIPGMHHCQSGPGAWNIGQTYPLDSSRNDTEHNALLALVDWVEGSNAPPHLIGTGDDGKTQRTHCVYPDRSIWNRKDDTKTASSWSCQSPGTVASTGAKIKARSWITTTIAIAHVVVTAFI